MIRYLVLCSLLLASCIDSSLQPENSIQSDTANIQQAPPKEDEPLDAAVRDLSDVCIPQRFAANAIPSNFKLDPNCPPDIFAPQRFIPPWDHSPVF